MKNVIKFILVCVTFVSANVFAATMDGSLIVGGAYSATGGSNLGDATTIDLGTVFANGGTGDVVGTISIFTPAGTGNSASLTAFLPVNNFFTVGGWTLDLSTLNVIQQSVGVLNLSGVGVLSGNGFDATNVDWSLSSQSTTSYSMTVSNAVVPVPAAAWLFGSGLLGLVGIARRRT
jgi:hypothetical protein